MRKWIAMILGSMSLFMAQASLGATYIGSWDLRGNGTKDLVYREGLAVRVVESGGSTRDYPIGNVAWSFVDARDTNGSPGAELVVRAGNDLVVISHVIQSKRTYPVGNISWAVADIAELNNKAGDEILINTVRGIKIITDATQSVRDVDFNHNGTWALFAIADLSGDGAVLILNMGWGVKLLDPRTYSMKDYSFQGYSAIFGTAQLDAKTGVEIIGRTTGTVYVISGGINSGRIKEYPATTSSAWAIYGRTADTDGKAGDEIILVMQGFIRIVSHSSGASRDYPVPGGNYTIDSVTNLDGRAGNEIVLRDSVGTVYVLSDRAGTLQRM